MGDIWFAGLPLLATVAVVGVEVCLPDNVAGRFRQVRRYPLDQGGDGCGRRYPNIFVP
jgi:hypothetical protein